MFNRSGFNRTKFNTNSSSDLMSGYASIEFLAEATATVEKIAPDTTGQIIFYASAEPTLEKFIVASEEAEIIFYISAETTLEKFARTEIAEIVFNTESVLSSTSNESNIVFTDNLILKPGDVLVIDTGKQTVTLNGQNAMKYFSRDSDFFKLEPGENVVVYEDGVQNRDVTIDIIWKDRWQ